MYFFLTFILFSKKKISHVLFVDDLIVIYSDTENDDDDDETYYESDSDREMPNCEEIGDDFDELNPHLAN